MTEAYAALSASERGSLLEQAMNTRVCDLESTISLEFFHTAEERPPLDAKIEAAKQQISEGSTGVSQRRPGHRRKE